MVHDMTLVKQTRDVHQRKIYMSDKQDSVRHLLIKFSETFWRENL